MTMAQAPQTIEGWYCLHDMRRLNWAAWMNLSQQEKEAVVQEAARFWEDCLNHKDAEDGSATVAALLGHKGDLMFMILRPQMDQLLNLEYRLNQLRLAAWMERTTSFVSVVELSQYGAAQRAAAGAATGVSPQEILRRRLEPQLPATRFLSFYPMDKKRGETVNWYTLEIEERARMMRSHGQVGANYKDRVQQIVTGSIGFDDWEWGVTLFADDPLQLKKIVQEMRFDEASAKYGIFGPFYIGRQLQLQELVDYLMGRWQPQ